MRACMEKVGIDVFRNSEASNVLLSAFCKRSSAANDVYVHTSIKLKDIASGSN